MKKISIGIIGLGNIGLKRLKAIQEISKFAKINVICEKKIKKKYLKINIINDYKKIVNYNLDLIIICTSTKITEKIYPYFVGKYHLLIEKPIELNINKLSKNIKKSNYMGKILKAGYNLRYDSGLRNIYKMLKEKLIGKIYYCKITYANGTAQTNTNNIGSIYDMASHSINLLMWLFNCTNLKLLSSFNQKNEFSKKHADNGFAIFKIKNILINLHHGFCNWKNVFLLEIYGKKGALIIKSLPKWNKQTIILHKRKLPSGIPITSSKKFIKDLSFKNEIIDIIKKLQKRKIENLKEINNEAYYTLKNTTLLKNEF
jgi:predicted dehydrogenase